MSTRLLLGFMVGLILGGGVAYGWDWAEQQGYQQRQEQREQEILNNQRQQMLEQHMEKRSPC